MSGHNREMAAYTKLNFKQDVEDMAPKFGMSPGLESRFARKPLGLQKQGLSYFRIAPGFRVPFGHTHSEQEEVYIVASGSARVKIEDDVVELGQWDAVRIPAEASHGMEAGPDGAELIAIGAPNTENADVEMKPGWWSD